MTTEDVTRYEQLCSELDRLETEFQSVADGHSELHIGLFKVDYWEDQQVEMEGWEAFHASAAGRVSNDGWEEWEYHPNGFGGCYFGDADLLSRFRRLAKSGVLILSEIDREVSRWPHIPSGYSLDLPSRASHEGWIDLLFETANLSTAQLRFNDYRYWDLPSPKVLDDLDESELWITKSDGIRFFQHPLFRTLHMDLFRSSAEAIRIWRHRVDVVPVDGMLDDDVICLPDLYEVTNNEPAAPPISELLSVPDPALEKPDWNGYEWRGRNQQVIKTYSDSAAAVTQLLTAFQQAGWQKKLSDPCGIRGVMKELESQGFQPKPEAEKLIAKRRRTVHELNIAQSEIFFKCQGGFSVSWTWRDESKDAHPS